MNGLAKPRKKANGPDLRHMKVYQWLPRKAILLLKAEIGNVEDIAPYEQFISDRPSPEASVAIFTSRHMNSL